MAQPSTMLKVLVVGEDEDVRGWLKNQVSQHKLPWRMRMTCPLRILSPDNQVAQQDIILVIWDRSMPVPISEILTRKEISKRSSESAISEIEALGGEAKLRRTIVLASSVTREDAVFLAEYGVRVVFTLPPKRSHWDREGEEFAKRLTRLHEEESSVVDMPEEKAEQKFMELIGSWDRLSDETKMSATEGLLRALGDSSRYAELIARKCIKESDKLGAEQWLNRAISKNPNYLRAMRLLADLYVNLGRYSEAISLFEKLQAYNPRNFQRLTQIGKCYLALGQIQKAEKVLVDALAIDEFHMDAREELGKVKVVMGEYDTARLLLANSPHRRQLAAFLNGIGIRMVEQHKYAESIEHYKKAQFVLPGNDQSHMLFFNIGLAYAKWGKLKEADRYVRLALVKEPCYDKAQSLLKSLQQTLGTPPSQDPSPRAA